SSQPTSPASRVSLHDALPIYPVRMLWVIPRAKLEEIADDPDFLAVYDRAVAGLDDARAARNTWWSNRFPQLAGQSIAYFSAEFEIGRAPRLNSSHGSISYAVF